MITILKSSRVKPFSFLKGNPLDKDNPPQVELSEIGEIIREQIENVKNENFFDVEKYVIMPDHVHILWEVKTPLPRLFGYYVGLFKSACSYQVKQRFPHLLPEEDNSIFQPKFNDRIAFTDKVAQRFSTYISSNPRKRLLTLLYPQFFNKVHSVRILEKEFDVYGNFQLLAHPVIVAGVVNSRSPHILSEQRRNWEEAIRSGGVIVSTFKSNTEKQLRKDVLDGGGSIIRIVELGMGPKYRPSGEDFTLCAEGRCLHIGLPRPSAARVTIRGDICVALNRLVFWIADHPNEVLSLIRAQQ